MKITIKIIAFAMIACVAPSSSHAADPKGKTSTVGGVMVLNPGSLDYGSYRGYALLMPVDGVSPMETYKWGGVSCPNSDLTATQVATMIDLIQRQDVWLTASYRNGQPATTRCIVGFSVIKV